MPTVDQLLDLAPGIGQRQATFRFALVDAASGRALGDIQPVRTPPSRTHDTSRKTCRSMAGLVLDRADTAAVNAVTDRVQVFMVIGGAEKELGTYVFTDTHRTRTTHGRRGEYGLADLGFVVAQPTESTVGFGAGTNVGTAIATILAAVPSLAGYEVEPGAAVTGAPIAWPAGTDRGRILEDLATLGAYLSPYMGNDSVIRVRRSFDPAEAAPSFTFESGGRVRSESISESDDLLEAPNLFVVVDNSNTAAPVVGRYEVPVSAPHSYANRGFWVPQVTDMQGVGTSASADVAARALGLAHTVYQQVTLATPPDPRHDAYDVVAYDGVNWLETAWSLPLIEGGEMTHTLRRAYNLFAGESVSDE